MKYLSQRDPLWASRRLGASNLTVGRFGCTTTCISMILDYFKQYRSPLELASNANNYTSDGLVLWKNITSLFVWRDYIENNAKISQYLKDKDKAVILQVNNKQHWIVALRKSLIGNDYLCLDPWDGKKCWVKKKYHNITGAAYFMKK